MKKIIITLLILAISILEVSAFSTWSIEMEKKSINNLEAKIFKLKNKKLGEKIIELDNKISEINNENSKFKNNIEILDKEINNLKIKNLVLESKKSELNNKINEKRELRDIVKDFYNHIFWDFQNSMKHQPNEEKIFIYILIYLIFSLFVFIFFLIFTLPLRLLRWFFRLFSGYKPCSDEKTKGEFNKIIKKYRIFWEQVKKLTSDVSNLVYENNNLKNRNKNLKNRNKNLKEKNYKLNLDIQKQITSNAREKINNKKIKEKKPLTINSQKKDKSNLFSKKKDKFSLKSNKKSKLFD